MPSHFDQYCFTYRSGSPQMPRSIDGHGEVIARYPPPTSMAFPFSSRICASMPGNGLVADRGRRGVEDRDLVPLDDVPEAILFRPVGRPFVDHHRRSGGERTVDDVRVAGDPSDVGGAPVDVVLLQVEDPLARRETSGEIP